MNRRIEVNIMDGLKKIVTILALMMFLATGAMQAMAQDTSSTQGSQDTQSGQADQIQAQPAETHTGETQTGTATEDLMTIIENNPDLSAYAQALKASGNDQMLSGEGSYVIFAPTDQAIKRDLGETSASDLSSAGKYLVEGTIVQNPKAPSEGSKQATLTTINGQRIDIVKSNGQITANGVKITDAIAATNGFVVITDGIV
jgi:uncharacterized surface protein with fasciclin (FAS1) repeats